MEESLERELRRALRGKQQVALLMLDIDHFKPRLGIKLGTRYCAPREISCKKTRAGSMSFADTAGRSSLLFSRVRLLTPPGNEPSWYAKRPNS